MPGKSKPIFNQRIFWDVDFENIDYDSKARFVIERVFLNAAIWMTYAIAEGITAMKK